MNYKDAGRLAEAIPLLEEGYRASKTHASLRGFGVPLLDAYAQAGEAGKFADLLKEQLADARRTLPKDSLQLAGLLAQLGLALLQNGAYAEAEPYLRECLAIREKKEPDDWRTFNTWSMLGGALLGQKQYADAEPLLVAGYEGLKQREQSIPKSGGGELRIPEALDRLVELAAATNQPDEVAKWRAERAAYPFVAPPPRPSGPR